MLARWTNVDLINTGICRSRRQTVHAKATVEVGVGGAVTKVPLHLVVRTTALATLFIWRWITAAAPTLMLQVPASGITEFAGTALKVITSSVCAISRLSVGFGPSRLDLSRDELDVTTLPCSVSEACGKQLASFRKTQAGFATATGTMEVYFTCDNESIQNKILQGSLQRTQGGASVRLYVCTKTDAQGEIDVDSSLYIEADIQLLGMSFSVDPDNPTVATINFGVTSVASAFGLS